MRWYVLLLISMLVVVGVGVGIWIGRTADTGLLSPGGGLVSGPKEKPLEQFTFDNLAHREFSGSKITLEEVLAEDEQFTSSLFTYFSDGKKVSGLANIPHNIPVGKRLPVIVMLRGYVDQEAYQTGVGTWKAGEVFAQNGFITLAPDFLGFGESDMPEDDVWWERLSRPVQVLNLLASVKTLPQADPERIGIWAHSNGGQVALSVLEITQQPYPTTLWAPVSKPFPYSILYYTDEFDDEGKALRAELAQFEKEYDVRQFSITDYLEQIKAPVQIHQGTADDAVPQAWSDELVEKLEAFELEVDYFVYPGADHNMVGPPAGPLRSEASEAGSWDTVVARDVTFFRNSLR